MNAEALAELRSDFGAKLQAVRQERGLSQEHLAFLSGVTGEAVRRWELGVASPRTDNLIRLAAALGCTVEELMPDDYGDRYSPQGVLVELGKLYGRSPEASGGDRSSAVAASARSSSGQSKTEANKRSDNRRTAAGGVRGKGSDQRKRRPPTSPVTCQ
jgi:transcriptional regulator with XRE-family HTH domain